MRNCLVVKMTSITEMLTLSPPVISMAEYVTVVMFDMFRITLAAVVLENSNWFTQGAESEVLTNSRDAMDCAANATPQYTLDDATKIFYPTTRTATSLNRTPKRAKTSPFENVMFESTTLSNNAPAALQLAE